MNKIFRHHSSCFQRKTMWVRRMTSPTWRAVYKTRGSLWKGKWWLDSRKDHTTTQITYSSLPYHSLWSTGRRSARRVLGVEPRAPYDGDELQDTDRLFTGPRYATAVFRLVYCTWSCTCAVIWLRDANFVPFAVGGSGYTRNCWDLKGGVAGETTADFDDSNAVLRKYFLVQASYHLHSWATHWMSLIALWWYGTSLVSIRKSMVSYWRALLQHLLALAMIGGCYFFSSLRRLGAIGIFALDISSLFVHLLQLCINAPPGTWWNKPHVIAGIHRGLVIPVFLCVSRWCPSSDCGYGIYGALTPFSACRYTRFYVFPFVVWYSAIYESNDWLQQMERTLFPGSAKAMKMVFHAFMAVNLVLNLISFKRLLFHPHMISVMNKSRSTVSNKGSSKRTVERRWQRARWWLASGGMLHHEDKVVRTVKKNNGIVTYP